MNGSDPAVRGWSHGASLLLCALGTPFAVVALTFRLFPVGAMLAGTPWRTAPWTWAAVLGAATLGGGLAAAELLRRSAPSAARERLIVVAIVGALTLGAAPDVLHLGGKQCANARVTLREMSLLGGALERRRQATGGYPATGRDLEALADALEPTWVARLPREDRWGRRLVVDVEPDGWSVRSRALVSLGGKPITLDRHGVSFPRECGCPGDLIAALDVR